MTREIHLMNNADELTQRFIESADKPQPPTQPVFFHTLDGKPAGPTITVTVDGVRGFIAERQLAGIDRIGNRARLCFDDGGSVIVDRDELESVSRQLAEISRQRAERTGAKLRMEGMSN